MIFFLPKTPYLETEFLPETRNIPEKENQPVTENLY